MLMFGKNYGEEATSGGEGVLKEARGAIMDYNF